MRRLKYRKRQGRRLAGREAREPGGANRIERQVAEALRASDDVGAAITWSQLLDELAGDLRVAVTAGLGENGPRWRQELPDVPGCTWVWIEPDDDDLGLGAQRRLLGAHALVFLTPITSPLGQHDRRRLAELEHGGPAGRGVLLADEALIERLSDDPDAERAQIQQRLQGLLPDGWRSLVRGQLTGWLEGLRSDAGLRARRRREVGCFLLADRIERQRGAIERVQTLLETADGQLASADEDLADLQKQARRWAAHTLAIFKRQTAELAVDLAEFLHELDQGLPGQIHGVTDINLLRKSLPHWLTHVVEAWLDDRIARWRSEVLSELQELELEDPLQAQLVLPALQPGHLRGETRWAQRLATTAAFGGAAALLALGLWIPSLLAVAGGIAWSTAHRGASEEEERHTLLLSAREALQQMGQDAERLLGEQLDQLALELEALRDEGLASASLQQARSTLEQEASNLRADLATMHACLGALESAHQRLEAV